MTILLLFLAFMVGGYCGMLVMALMAIAKKPTPDVRAGEEGERWQV